MPRAAREAQWGAETQPHRRGWGGSWGPWQGWQQPWSWRRPWWAEGCQWLRPQGPGGNGGLRRLGLSLQRGSGPFLCLRPSLWSGTRPLELRGQTEALSWWPEPQEAEGAGLQERDTCSSPRAAGPRARLGPFDHPLPHTQKVTGVRGPEAPASSLPHRQREPWAAGGETGTSPRVFLEMAPITELMPQWLLPDGGLWVPVFVATTDVCSRWALVGLAVLGGEGREDHPSQVKARGWPSLTPALS